CHAAGEFVRVLAHSLFRFGDSDVAKCFGCDGACFACGDTAVGAAGIDELAADGQYGVESSSGVLEDHRDLGASDLAPLRFGHAAQVLSVEEDGTGGAAEGPGSQAEHGQRN